MNASSMLLMEHLKKSEALKDRLMFINRGQLFSLKKSQAGNV